MIVGSIGNTLSESYHRVISMNGCGKDGEVAARFIGDPQPGLPRLSHGLLLLDMGTRGESVSGLAGNAAPRRPRKQPLSRS